MNNVLKYKNFTATVQYSDEDEAFIGRVVGIDSVVSFEGQSVEELQEAFQEAVESYVQFCRRKGIILPQKSYTGAFNMRLTPELRRKPAFAASVPA